MLSSGSVVRINAILTRVSLMRLPWGICGAILTPVAFLQMRELFLQLSGGHAFDVLDDLGRAQGRWTRYQDMHVIDADMALDNGQFAAHTHLTDNVARAFGYLSAQHLIAVLGSPHQVVLDVVDRVSTFAIFWHVYPRRDRLEDNSSALKLFA
jgi:hypothetical protein